MTTFASKNEIFRCDGGVGWVEKTTFAFERRDGGLLLGTEALHFAFRRDGGVGWVLKTTVVSKDETEGFWCPAEALRLVFQHGGGVG